MSEVKMMRMYGDYEVLPYEADNKEIEAAKERLMQKVEDFCAEDCKKPFSAYKFTMEWIVKKFEMRQIPAKFVYGKDLPEGLKADDLVLEEAKTTVGLKFSVPEEDLLHPEIAE